jgi:sulfonate transport system permease protein
MTPTIHGGLAGFASALRRQRDRLIPAIINGLATIAGVARRQCDRLTAAVYEGLTAIADAAHRQRDRLSPTISKSMAETAGAARRQTERLTSAVDEGFAALAGAARQQRERLIPVISEGLAPIAGAARRSIDRLVTAGIHKGLAAIAFTLLVIALWQAAVQVGLVNRLFVAAPLQAFDVIVERAEAGSLWTTLAATAQRLGLGWITAVVVAMLLGAAIGNSRVAHQFLAPTLEFFRPLPASAVIPVAILFFGLTTRMSTFVVAFGSIWPILLAAIHGFANVPRELREVASTLEMGRLRYIFTIATPSASVDIMAGLRISLALALILTVVTEMQASLPGLGYEIFMAQRTFRTADLYAGLMTLGIFGFLINQALLLAERRLMRWKAA